MSDPIPPDPRALVRTLKRNLSVIERNVDGIDRERSVLAVVPGGSHLNWLLGHLVAARDLMLQSLDAETVWDGDTAAAYRRGSLPGPAPEARPLEELLDALRDGQRRLERALDDATEAHLDAPHGNGTVGEWVEFLAWHESYHAGQKALYRRLAGLEGVLG